MRNGLLLVLGAAMLLGIGTVAFLAQGSPTEPTPLPSVVAKVADVSLTPRATEVLMRQGADRVLQRERTGLGPCRAGMMGCPGTMALGRVTVFLVRDELGFLHAYVGEDPRNGCALEWLSVPPVFHDVCHGSLYDRQGRRVGGPSPYDLNALATEERGGDLYVDPTKILVGLCSGCPR